MKEQQFQLVTPDRKEHAEKALNSEVERVLGDLGLTPEQLQNKKVADIEAGRRFIAAYCAKNNITDEVYSVEPNFGTPPHDNSLLFRNFRDTEGEIKKKTLAAEKEALPLKDETFDIVLMHNVLTYQAKNSPEESKIEIFQTLDESTRILKPGGEIRMWPFFPNHYLAGRDVRKYDSWRKQFLAKLNALRSTGQFHISYEKAPMYAGVERIDSERVIIRKKIVG